VSETKHMPGRENGTATKMTRMVAPDDAGSDEDVKLTPLRQAVLQTLVAAGRPLGAYDLLTEIEASTGRRLMPPSTRNHGIAKQGLRRFWWTALLVQAKGRAVWL